MEKKVYSSRSRNPLMSWLSIACYPASTASPLFRHCARRGRKLPSLFSARWVKSTIASRDFAREATTTSSKPFAFSELLARLEAIVRRGDAEAVETRLQVADLEMDLLTRQVRRASQTIELQPREFRLLEHLMHHAGQVVTRTMLLEKVWDYHFDPQTNVIDVHVSRLRSKVDKGFDYPLIHTVRGAGYVLRAITEAAS